ncbi:uncharacterized protein LOC144128236 [Amblyomma americanum]
MDGDISAEQMEAWAAYDRRRNETRRKRIAEETPEQRAVRLAKCREYAAARRSDEELQAFEKKLAAVHVQFSTTSSRNHKCGASQLMFSSNRGTVPVSLDMPFQVVRQVDKDCVLGIDHHKDKCESTSTAQDPTDWSSEVFCKKKDQAARNQEEGVHCKHASKVDQHVPRIQG